MTLSRSTRGLSLVEVLLATLILSLSLPSTIYFFTVVLQQDAQSHAKIQAGYLAHALMSEISHKKFYESSGSPGNGPEGGEISGYSRVGFDDIDDYQIFDSTWGALNPPRDEGGNTLSNFGQFSQSVKVWNVDAPTSGPTARASDVAVAAGTTDFKVVEVKVSWDESRQHVQLYKVFSNEQ